ncbi:NAD(P)-dependent oxidoreductase [Phyllobacterium sp. SB3]|uniref:NAD-dependent epimerase/dehydratase family protein n=1 Tax=Phyllobacterium sp. SB3 TaxID=3156073 RepID=UPI0032AF1CCC
MKKKNVLITGGCGLLGSYVAAELQTHCGVTRFDIAGPETVDFVRGDVRQLTDIRAAVRNHEMVIHIAALANIWAGTPEEIMDVNVTGVWNVLRAAEMEGVRRVVLCSSDSVIGFTVNNEHLQTPSYVPVDERHNLNATDPYGLSKIIGENIGRSFALRGTIEVVVLRPVFILYPDMMAEIRARSIDPENYKGPAAGGQTPAGGGRLWHYVDPRDVARAFRLAIEIKDVRFESFFISGPSHLHPQPTLERLKSICPVLPIVNDQKLYEEQPFAPIYDLEHARNRLGYSPQHDLRALVYPQGTPNNQAALGARS